MPSKLKEELTAIGFEVTLDKVDFETYQQSWRADSLTLWWAAGNAQR